MQSCYLAVDIGASSGRHIVGWVDRGKICLQEVYRFENGLMEQNGHLCWRLDQLAQGVLEGLKAAHAAGFAPVSLGIDTWAVDFVLLDQQDRLIGEPVAYRDGRTAGMREKLELRLPFAEHYAHTGIQYQAFNTVYQLAALKQEHPNQLERARAFLMIPDYLNFLLTGVKANEYTNATTTALVNAETGDWDEELLERVGLPRDIFQTIRMPGQILGRLKPEVAAQVGFDCPVILPATHDTGSAFLAVPAVDKGAVTLSSGTWSLLGVENPQPVLTRESCLANFTNEGGYDRRFRYLKNIMGLWMIQSVRRELGETRGQRPEFPELIAAARRERDFPSVLDVDDPRFLAPVSMIQEVKAACRESGQPEPQNTGQVMQCVYNSLTLDYAKSVKQLESLTGRSFTSMNIVGGGSQDGYLNQLTANATGLQVYAGPTEGTALGNLLVQFLAGGEFESLAQAREAVRTSFDIAEYIPEIYCGAEQKSAVRKKSMLVETKAKVGVFSIALGAYLPQFPSLVPEFQAQYAAFKDTLPNTVELVDGGLVTTKEAAMAAGDKFRAADVDLVFLQLLTYATSYNLLPAVRDLDVPVVLVNLQKKRAPDYPNTDIPTWLGQLYACGAVGEMVADLERAGKRHAVITGVVEGEDPQVEAEIQDWCRAAQVRRRFRQTNIAQIGRPYPGMMDLYIDETNLYNRMGLYTKQFDWEKMWAIADDITDEAVIRAKAQEILDTFEIEGGATVETVWEMARYVVAFEQWVQKEQLALVASHYDGFAQGRAGVLDSMLIPAFSMLIKQGTACAVEGDMKVAMAMSILKTIAGTGQLSEMYSIDFDQDICIIGHSGSGDADISIARKPTMKIVPVFHGKTGGGYLTQFYPPAGEITYLAITQDRDGHFKFVVAEGVNEEGPIFTFGDTNMRTRFSLGAREFCNRWSEAGPTHHMAAAIGRHAETILKVGKILNVPVEIICR